MKCDVIKQLTAEKKRVSILFVCSGNIIRSPYAEMLFEKMIAEQDHELSSRFKVDSGAVTYKNVNISTMSMNALMAEGVLSERIKKFFPRHIDDHPDLFSQADLILVMTTEHLSRLEKYENKSYLITSFAGLSEEDVPDPYFESTPEIAFKMIKDSLQAIINCLI
ncbi:MAG: arsenate reductase/protein-tyrosine-phosphatase family protein [Candidatus Hodarchaeales archaeon]